MRVFDGGSLAEMFKGQGVSSVVSLPSSQDRAASSKASTAGANLPNNAFHANPMPKSLKKMSNANQSLERYMQRTTNAKSERTILTKHSSEQ